MSTDAPVNRLTRGKERSPTDPHECCVWANERMRPDLAELGYKWVVIGNKEKPIALVRP